MVAVCCHGVLGLLVRVVGLGSHIGLHFSGVRKLRMDAGSESRRSICSLRRVELQVLRWSQRATPVAGVVRSSVLRQPAPQLRRYHAFSPYSGKVGERLANGLENALAPQETVF